jgi:hypothetical protein
MWHFKPLILFFYYSTILIQYYTLLFNSILTLMLIFVFYHLQSTSYITTLHTSSNILAPEETHTGAFVIELLAQLVGSKHVYVCQ